MNINIRKDGSLIESYTPGYYWCGVSCCSGDTPTPPGPEPPGPEPPITGDTGITAIRIIVADSITDNGRASSVFTPATADTILHYTSSDEETAMINEDTGEIIVLKNGVVTFCVEDLITGLDDCKEVNVYKSIEPTPDTGDTGYTGITSIQIIVPNTITDEGEADYIFLPVTADTVIVFSSSDETTATIDPDTGEIEVLKTGFVTFCVEDQISELIDCKTVYVVKTEEPGPDTGDTGTTEYRLKLVFDVTSTTVPTTVINRHSNVVKAELEDGTEIPLGNKKYVEYVFQQTGRNNVYLTLNNQKIIHYMFCAWDETEGEKTTDRLVEVEVGDGITEIAAIAFESNHILTSITIPNSVAYIGDKAFLWADLRRIVLPNVKTIGYSAFMGNTNVGYAIIESVVPPSLDSTFGEVFEGNYPIYVPAGSVNTYKTNSDWSVYANRIQAIPNN